MPLYEYECDACGQRFETIQKYSDPPIDVCAKCGKGPVQRLLSSPAIQFKGSGWYITDYARKGSSDGAGKGGSDKSGSEKGGAEKAASDGGGSSKGESTSAAKSDAAPAAAPSSSPKS